MTREEAERMWNVATGGEEIAPATAFAGIVVACGAPKYIPIHDKDFTAGNNGAQAVPAADFLQQWAAALREMPAYSKWRPPHG